MRAIAILATFLIISLAAHAAPVNVQQQPDGTYYTAVLNSGPSAAKYDIVFVGDGFTSSQQNQFNTAVTTALSALQAMVPYSQRMCGVNIWRVNVVSTDSGIDHPLQNIFKNTELDCRYGKGPPEADRCITSDSPAKCYEAADYAPDYDAVFVLVNDTQWGGCAGGLVFSSISPGFAGIITHELAHKIGGLADEYDCYVCDGSDSNLTYSGPEPSQVNLTKATTLATIKWNALILAGTPIPTTINNPPGVVGLWEGGGYYAKGIYRPQFTCHTRNTGSPFCAVCEQEMRNKLGSHCTECEIDPLGFACLFQDMLELVSVKALLCRWPLPFCPSCPVCSGCPFGDWFFDDLIYTIEGVGEDSVLNVIDDAGQVVATGRPVTGPQGQPALSVQFKARRDTQYFAELRSPAAAHKIQTLSSSILRNNLPQSLPRGVSR